MRRTSKAADNRVVFAVMSLQKVMNRTCLTAAGIVVSVACITISGCGTLASRPNTTTLDQFAIVDVVELKSDDAIVRIEDPAVIARLRDIYESAKWKPYVATLPANTRRISCLRDRNELFKLDYVGMLMEIEAYDDARYAELSDVDREWLDGLFARN